LEGYDPDELYGRWRALEGDYTHLRGDARAREHILSGQPGRPSVGGHRFGTGRPHKNEFPDIPDDDVIAAIRRANADPKAVQRRAKGRVQRVGQADGMVIVTVIQDHRISAAYPLRGDGVILSGPNGSRTPSHCWIRTNGFRIRVMARYWETVAALCEEVLPLLGDEDRAFAEPLIQEPVVLAAVVLDAAVDSGVSVSGLLEHQDAH
jgi:hypothetical protein